MAIQLVQTEEKLTYKAEGSEIYYRRISTLKRAAITRHHTKRGKTDWAAVTKEILEYVTIGWKTVQQAGVVIAFSSELIAALPEDTLTDLLGLSGGANPEMEDGEPGN